MAGSDDRFAGLAASMGTKNLINNELYKTPISRLNNQNKLDKIVNNWTKKNSIKFLGKVLSANSVPWGKVNTFSDFMKTRTAKQYLINANIAGRNIKVPECAIKYTKKKLFIKRKYLV